MSDSSSIREMADIIMPSPEPFSIPAWVVLLVFSVIATWILFHFFRPLPRLERQLKSGGIKPRNAAHKLADHSIDEQNLRTQLERLRFSRSEPQLKDVLELIKQVKRGR